MPTWSSTLNSLLHCTESSPRSTLRRKFSLTPIVPAVSSWRSPSDLLVARTRGPMSDAEPSVIFVINPHDRKDKGSERIGYDEILANARILDARRAD